MYIAFAVFGLYITAVFIRNFLIIIRGRQAAYDKLRLAYQELEESHDLKELGASTAVVNHEIKNHLFSLSANLVSLQKSPNMGQEEKQDVSAISEMLKKVISFSQEVLDLSKARIVADKTRIDIGGLIHATIRKHFASQSSLIEPKGPDTPVFIYADPVKIETVFLNLIKNSLEAEAKHILISLSPIAHTLHITVEDNGNGCEEKDIGQLFKAFYSKKMGGKGTGLGLAIARSIVESHGGSIHAELKNGKDIGFEKGLIVRIEVPMYKDGVSKEN
jgi:signal transduction histidine kinase